MLEHIGGWLKVRRDGAMLDYCERLVFPQSDRLQQLGVSEADIKRIWSAVLEQADFMTVGRAPDALMANIANRIEDGEVLEDILANW